MASFGAPSFDVADGLTPAHVTRYSRQMLLPDIGPAGQAAISRSAVLVVRGPLADTRQA